MFWETAPSGRPPWVTCSCLGEPLLTQDKARPTPSKLRFLASLMIS